MVPKTMNYFEYFHRKVTKKNLSSFSTTFYSVYSYTRCTKPSEVYNQSIEKLTEMQNLLVTISRNRTQIYNARKSDVSVALEYAGIMKIIEKNNISN